MQLTIVHEKLEVAGGLFEGSRTRYRLYFTTDFSDDELELIRSAKISASVLYLDPPITLPRFREPLLQRLAVGDLVKRRPNMRTFTTQSEAMVFDHTLRTAILPKLEQLIKDARRTRRVQSVNMLGPCVSSYLPSTPPGVDTTVESFPRRDWPTVSAK